MAELCNISLEQGGRQLEGITLSGRQYPERTRWVTLGAGAGINGEALVEALDHDKTGQVVACMAGHQSDPSVFIKKYPHHPAVALDSMDDLKAMFGKDESLAFYYPAVPSQARDKRILDVLEHFPRAIMLAEKPSHCTVEEAVTFKKQLAEHNIDESRFFVGMHSPLHPSRQLLLEQIEERKDQLDAVLIKNHYPKDPTVPGDGRCYDEKTGGAMLDLGVYVLQQADEVARLLGVDLLEELPKMETRDIQVKKAPNSRVDIETYINFKVKGVSFALSARLNPGTDTGEEQIVWFKESADEQGEVRRGKLTLGKACHPHWGNGVFLENHDGTVQTFPGSEDAKPSYSYQLDMCQDHLRKHAEGPTPSPSEWHTLDYQIRLLKLLDIVAELASTNENLDNYKL